MFMALVTAIPKMQLEMAKKLPEIINGIIKAINGWWSTMADAGTNLLKGLWWGIDDAGAWLWSKISGFFGGIMGRIKGFFGIASPSKLFKNTIGKNLALGIGEGFTSEMDSIAKDMQEAIPTDFNYNLNPAINSGAEAALPIAYGAHSNGSEDYLISAFQKALTGMAFIVDGDKFGEMVVNKVERVVFA